MKAVQFDRFGPPEVLDLVDIPIPEARPGEVLVRVRAAGINFFEVLMRADRYAMTPTLPMMPGVEVAGVIERAGEGVDRSRLGRRVAVPLFALGRAGGYAEFVTVDAAEAIELPDGLAFEAAAALMVQGLTALHLVRRRALQGKTVLVHAAAGGVGSLLVQLAKRGGAGKVIATAGGEEKTALAHSLGADLVVDYTSADWPERLRTQGGGADLVYDTIGGGTTRASLDVLAPGGELIFAALGRFTLTREDLDRVFDSNQSLTGFALLPLLTRETLRQDLAALFELAASGDLKLLPGSRFALAEVASAHRAIEERRVSGKVVLVP